MHLTTNLLVRIHVITFLSITGLFFAASSSANGDYYGGERIGDNLYCDSVLAINVTTGQLVWYRQLVHHNVWDYVR